MQKEIGRLHGKLLRMWDKRRGQEVDKMKTFSVRVSIRAECEADCIERIQDLSENPIDNFIDQSIKEVESD